MKPFDPEELAAWRSFSHASRKLVAHLEADLARHGLTLADHAILLALAEAPEGSLRQCDLAERSGLSASRLTYRVDRLVAGGLVARRACTEDRRVSYAVITRAGRARLREATPTHLAGVRNHFHDVVGRGSLRSLRRATDRILASLTDEA